MIIPLRYRQSEADIPLVAFIDLQVPQLPSVASLVRPDVAEALQHAASLLSFARRQKLPIAHFRMRWASAMRGQRSEKAAWISGFEPRGNEHVFERTRASCFSNASFENMLRRIEAPEIIFAGLSAEDGCLATAIDLSNRGYHGSFVKDCSMSNPMGRLCPRETRAVVYDLIARYAKVVALNQVMRRDNSDPRAMIR